MIRAFDGIEPRIAPTATVVAGATVIGDVRLDDLSSVWPGAVLRGDIAPLVVGARSNIQDNAVLHCVSDIPVLVGQDVTVGHGAILHSCTVGDASLIGMGAIVLDGAVVGSGCIIGAGALVPPNMKIEDGQMVMGSPAKVKRPLTDEEKQGIVLNAQRYLDLSLKYR